MTLNIPKHFMLQQICDNKIKKQQGGYVLLLSVLILGSLAALIIPSLILLGIDNYKNTYDLANSQSAIELVNTCGEDATRKMRRNKLGGELIVYPSEDTVVSSTNSTYNYGIADEFFVNANAKGLIKFDLSTIPAGTTITSAKISLYATANQASSATYSVHEILSANGDWQEGNENDEEAEVLYPSWDYKDTGNSIAWAGSAGLSTAGVDYRATAEDTYTGTISNNTRYEFDLTTATVQSWIDTPSSNYGLLLRTASANTVNFATKEVTNPRRAPQLIIQYSGDSNSSGGQLVIRGEDWCYYNVLDLGGENREIRAISFVEDVIRKVSIVVDDIRPKVNVVSWQEVPDF